MPSFKSRLIAFVIRNTRKKAFMSPDGLHRWIAKSRKTQDHRPPAAVAARLDMSEHQVAGQPVYEAKPRGGAVRKRILYIHGGAYVFEMTRFHWNLVAELVERLDAHVTVPIYPLAPEHDIHAMLDMVMATYRRMVDDEPGTEIVFMGDSAGGNLSVVLTMLAAEQGLPLPHRHVLISPGLDMTLTNPETHAVARIDPWLGIPGGLEAVRLYSAGIAPSDWRVSPANGDLSRLPKTLIFAGTHDLLTPDTRRYADKARLAGIDVELVIGDGMFHVWPLLDLPETRAARDRMVAFLSDAPAAG